MEQALVVPALQVVKEEARWKPPFYAGALCAGEHGRSMPRAWWASSLSFLLLEGSRRKDVCVCVCVCLCVCVCVYVCERERGRERERERDREREREKGKAGRGGLVKGRQALGPNSFL